MRDPYHHTNITRPWKEGHYNGFHRGHCGYTGTIQNRAFARGHVPRPERCMVCHTTEGTIIAHLEDYLAPFDYLPVCYPCHKAIHVRFDRPDVFLHYRDRIAKGWKPPVYQEYNWRLWNRTIRDVLPTHWPLTLTANPGDTTLYDLLPLEYPARVLDVLNISTGAEHLPGQHIHTVAQTLTLL